jgi:beta-glucanase (GH16 family)
VPSFRLRAAAMLGDPAVVILDDTGVDELIDRVAVGSVLVRTPDPGRLRAPLELHSGSDTGRGWTSGRFETQADTFGAAAGGVVRMQASIRQPNVTRANGAGYWPAFWMLGQGLRKGGNWPDIGEIDILEDINGRGSVFGTLHCGVNPGGPCNESSGIGSGERACAGCQTGFHTYAVEIDRKSSPERIRWFLDGKNYFTLEQNRVDARTWTHAVDHSFFIIFDLAIGGGFPAAFGGGPNGDTVSGGAMKVDYVAVYNRR